MPPSVDPFTAPDAELGEPDPRVRHFGDASKGQRVVNLLVDWVAAQVCQMMLMMLAFALVGEDAADLTWLAFLAGFFAYYVLLEGLFGRTLGKALTGTRVVRAVDGQPPSWAQIFGRTAARLVPFEAFSFLAAARGWHDDWSGTHVVRLRGD